MRATLPCLLAFVALAAPASASVPEFSFSQLNFVATGANPQIVAGDFSTATATRTSSASAARRSP